MNIVESFAKMGARVKVSELTPRQHPLSGVIVDVRKDKEGEYFDLRIQKDIEMMILDVQKKDRHLLLMTKKPGERPMDTVKSKFLCGHDERTWFTCAIPESEKATNVLQAKEALKPKLLREIEAKEGLKTTYAQKRHRKLKTGKKIHRQGEFMFVPEPDVQFEDKSLIAILKNEPMRRGRNSNPHIAQYLVRQGGTTVYVSSYNNKSRSVGLTQSEYNRVQTDPKAKTLAWQMMQREPTVFVKGRITHKEHATLDLGDVWHRVMLNTEDQALAAGSIAFLD